MRWGSNWNTIQATGTNPFRLFQWSNWYALQMVRIEPYHLSQWSRTESIPIAEVQEKNAGGGTSSGVNPFLRVRSGYEESVTPQLDTAIDIHLNTLVSQVYVEPESKYVYAAEIFDRQQETFSREADSRWLRRHRKPIVPVIDGRLTVAFQKFLQHEEYEFITLLVAIEDD